MSPTSEMHSPVSVEPPLGPEISCLVEAVEAACGAPAFDLPAQVEAALREYARDASILPAHQQAGGPQCYTRHLVHADARGRFSIVALVWDAGQQTPVHAHYTWCAYRVLHGSLQEDRYRWNPETCVPELRATIAREPGDTGAGHAGWEQIHRLRHCGTTRAISLHVYGIDGERVATHVNRLTTPA